MAAKKLIILALALLLLAVAAFAAFEYSRWNDKQRYPQPFQDEVRAYAQEYQLDPLLVWSVMRAESSYRVDAVSSVGASGLMQIMPETGEWIAQKLKEGDYEQDWLFIPDHNIRYGCWYLRYLLDRYDERLTPSLAAYNAGGTNVDKWLKDPQYCPDGETLVHIPFEQPRVYVQRVLGNYQSYRRIYEGQETIPGGNK